MEVKVEDKINLRHDYSDNLVYNAQHDYLCPNCNYEFTQENYLNKVNFCPKCGQHLMWELARWKTVSK